MPHVPARIVTLAVLAGGTGARMGKPKALLSIEGQPILEYLLERLEWPGPSVLVTAPGREHPPGFKSFTREICDPESGAGPLRGLLTALEHLTTPMLAILTVDMPAVRPHQLQWLLNQLSVSSSALGLMASRGGPDQERVEPFPAVFRAGAAGVVRRHLASGRRAVHSLLADDAFVTVPAPMTWDPATWTNLNTPADLQAFLTVHAGRKRETGSARGK